MRMERQSLNLEIQIKYDVCRQIEGYIAGRNCSIIRFLFLWRELLETNRFILIIMNIIIDYFSAFQYNLQDGGDNFVARNIFYQFMREKSKKVFYQKKNY